MNQVQFYTLDVRHIMDTFNNSLAQATDDLVEAAKRKMEFEIKMSRGTYKLLHGLALIHNAYHVSLHRKRYSDYPIYGEPYIENVEAYVRERIKKFTYEGFFVGRYPWRTEHTLWKMSANPDVEEGHEREFLISCPHTRFREGSVVESKTYTIDEFLLHWAEKFAEQAAKKNSR